MAASTQRPMATDGSRVGFTSGRRVRMGAAKQVVPGLFVIPTGVVNTFLLDAADGCALIDAGLPDHVEDILGGIAAAGKRPTDVRHLIVTHAHPDHIGSPPSGRPPERPCTATRPTRRSCPLLRHRPQTFRQVFSCGNSETAKDQVCKSAIGSETREAKIEESAA